MERGREGDSIFAYSNTVEFRKGTNSVSHQLEVKVVIEGINAPGWKRMDIWSKEKRIFCYTHPI